MKKKKELKFDEDVRKAIKSDPEYAAEYFEELTRRPLPVQFAIFRGLMGMTQEELAKTLHLKQTHISRLEKVGLDHLLSFYDRAAEAMGAHLAIIPENMTLVPNVQLKKSMFAHP